MSQDMNISKEYDIYLGAYRKTYHATLGQALRYVQEKHQELFLEWVYHHALSGTPGFGGSCPFSCLSTCYDGTAKIVVVRKKYSAQQKIFSQKQVPENIIKQPVLRN